MSSVRVVPMTIGIVLCTASVALFYKWYKTRNETVDKVDGIPSFKSKFRRQKTEKVESTVPNDMVPLICGRFGANLKAIEERTSVKISFREKDEFNQICEISGQYENVMKAAELIQQELARSKSTTDEMLIPARTHKKILRQSGKILHDICQRSYTQIHIDAGLCDKNVRRLLITGSVSNIQTAKRLIEEKIRQDTEELEAENKREPRHQKNPSPSTSVSNLSTHSSSSQSIPHIDLLSSVENLNSAPNASGSQVEVYVSAVASPARFWIQLVGPQTAQLERLINEMSQYYDHEPNQILHQIKDPYLGQIVAAKFQYDNKWYRSEIVGILPNEYDARNVVLDLYFLDYGDSIYVNPTDVFEMRTDFLTLRYQAIECFLANVEPTSKDKTTWDNACNSRFEELTHVAQWKKLIAKIVTTKEKFKPGDSNSLECAPVPGIELYDIIDGHEVSIASTLIVENFATAAKQSGSEAMSQSTASSTASESGHDSVLESRSVNSKSSNNNNSPAPSVKYSSSPRSKRSATKQTESNDSPQNGVTSDKSNNGSNFQNMFQDFANKSWVDIMEAESDA